MKKVKLQLILLSLVLSFTCRSQIKKPTCYDDYTAQLVARAYVLSMPLFYMENDLVALMAGNESYFTVDGKAIGCLKALGTALTQSGLESAAQNESYSATERFGGSMPEGLEHLPGQVDASLNSYSNEAFSMGLELLWLADVLPAAASGNYEPYNTTPTMIRQLVLEQMQVMQFLCQVEPGLCEYMQNLIMASQPALEEQVYLYARQLCN